MAVDKLRALRYFTLSAEQGSFSLAAERLQVSVPAVSKLVRALEREVGIRLFERGARGLALTTDGQAYLEACLPALEQLEAADDLAKGASARPRGVLVVGATPHLALHCLLPGLPRFRARYPELDIELRCLDRVTDVAPGVVDVFVLQGWPQQAEFVQRRVATTRLRTFAAPRYWA